VVVVVGDRWGRVVGEGVSVPERARDEYRSWDRVEAGALAGGHVVVVVGDRWGRVVGEGVSVPERARDEYRSWDRVEAGALAGGVELEQLVDGAGAEQLARLGPGEALRGVENGSAVRLDACVFFPCQV
jgi:hypothetical protein